MYTVYIVGYDLFCQVLDKELRTEIRIEGQQAPVVAVDWSAGDTGAQQFCLVGDMFGRVKLVTMQS